MTGSTYLCATSHIPAGSRLKDSLISLKYGLMQYAWNAFLSPWWRTEGVRVPPEFVFFTRRRRRRVSIYIYQSYYRREEKNTIIYRRFASCQRFVFFTRRRRGRVSIYQSYYRREETKYNRSEWCGGRALAFKSIGRVFAPRTRFVFFRRRRRVRLLAATYVLPLHI